MTNMGRFTVLEFPDIGPIKRRIYPRNNSIAGIKQIKTENEVPADPEPVKTPNLGPPRKLTRGKCGAGYVPV